MKICLFAHPDTPARFALLTGTPKEQVDIEICFPEEDLTQKNADIVIFEEAVPKVTEQLLSMEKPPVIVIPKEGFSTGHIRYLSDFAGEFPALLQKISERTPLLRIPQKNSIYSYRQEDILCLHQDEKLCIFFRQGTKIMCRKSLKKIAKQLSPRLFFSVGTDTFVNMKYVLKITDDAVFLQNGQKFPIPPQAAEQVKNAFFKAKYLNANADV